MADGHKHGRIVPPMGRMQKFKPFDEYGKTGLKQYAGIMMEEFLPQLQGQRGIQAYREMADNDDIVGAILFAIKMLIRQVDWDIEKQGNTAADKDAAEFVKSCIDDIYPNWANTVAEILSFLTYGWSYHEICYKRRLGKQKDHVISSKFDDGLIGWQKFPIRSQDTLWRWEYDENERLTGMSQMAPPDYAIRTIPREKALHFVTESAKENPEGRSILRNSYRLWYFKKRMQEIEGIGVERDLAGLPVLVAPEDVDLWDTEDPDMAVMLAYAETLVQNVRRDALEGIVLPHGWEFQLLSGGSKRQFEIGTIIERYDTRIAMTTMADFVLLGHQNVGSFALSSNKTKLFSVALGIYLDIICGEFNTHAIPKLIDLNAEHFKGITEYPKLIHGDVEERNLVELSTFLKDMIGIGLLEPDENLADYVRREANLPKRIEGQDFPKFDDEEEENEPEKGEKRKTGRETDEKPQNKRVSVEDENTRRDRRTR